MSTTNNLIIANNGRPAKLAVGTVLLVAINCLVID